MQAYRWNRFSSLDGSERSFMERIRRPDPNFPRFLMTLSVFSPIGLAMLMLPVVNLPMLTEAALGPKSWITAWLYFLSSYTLNLIPYTVVLSFVGMYALRGYIALKLRRQKRNLVKRANPRLKTDVENARLSGSLFRHGLAAWR
jgi:hypothetical protein